MQSWKKFKKYGFLKEKSGNTDFETLFLTIYKMYSFNFFKLIVDDSRKKIYFDCIQLKHYLMRSNLKASALVIIYFMKN